MNITLWVVQGLLAAIFLMAGLMKASQTKEFIKKKVGDWVEPVSLGTIRVIGVVEILGAIGVVVPMLFGFMPFLVPLAAVGLSLTMVVAAKIHLQRKELKETMINVIILLMAVFVLWGRFELL